MNPTKRKPSPLVSAAGRLRQLADGYLCAKERANCRSCAHSIPHIPLRPTSPIILHCGRTRTIVASYGVCDHFESHR